MTTLIIAEHNNQHLNLATLHAISAAQKLGEVDILVAGFQAATVAQEAANIQGVHQVLHVDAAHYEHQLAEELAPLVVSLAASYTHIGITATAFGKNLAPRIAALLDCSQISDLIDIIDAHTFIRPVYAGNALQTVCSEESKLVLTFRATAFDAASQSNNSVSIIHIDATEAQNISRFISRNMVQSDRPELTQARVIVSGGRALGSAEQFNAVLTPLANTLGAAIGASRAAVDAEYAPNDAQVGQTGKVVAPELYIAVGISGAIQHIAGMQDSKTIVAINKDPDAPIFNVADFGIVGDLFEIVPELTEALKHA